MTLPEPTQPQIQIGLRDQRSILHQLYDLVITTTRSHVELEMTWEVLSQEEEREISPKTKKTVVNPRKLESYKGPLTRSKSKKLATQEVSQSSRSEESETLIMGDREEQRNEIPNEEREEIIDKEIKEEGLDPTHLIYMENNTHFQPYLKEFFLSFQVMG
jgi:hypothetical protein